LHHWSFPIPLTILLALLLFCYARGWLHVRKAFPGIINLGHMAAFISGLVAIWVAVGSPLASMDHELLSIHMVQHLLLMAIAPPLIFLGAPMPALLHGVPRDFVQTVFGSFQRSASVRRIAICISHPMFCWFAGVITVIAWHLPWLFAIGMHSTLWHETEQASFLVAGFLFWWPVIQPWPSSPRGSQWSAPLYLFLATLPCDALSAFLMFCGRVIYPSYLTGPHRFDISALQDQEWAGVLMWVSVTLIYMLPAVVLTVLILTPGASETVTLGSKTSAFRFAPPRQAGE
jgi:putative membrane protein